MSTVWDRSVEFLGDNLSAALLLALLGLFLPLVLLGNLAPLFGVIGPAANAALGFLALALSLVTVWGNLAITALALDPTGGRGAASALGARRLLPFLGVSAVLVVATAVLTAPLGIALRLSGIDLTAVSAGQTVVTLPNPSAVAFGAVYFLAFLALILWLSARLALIIPVVVMERHGIGALAHAFRLTRPVQWKIVGVLLLYGLVSQVAAAAGRTVFGSVFALTIGGDGPIPLGVVLTNTIVAAISTAFQLVAIVFLARLYLALCAARDPGVRETRGAVEGSVGPA